MGKKNRRAKKKEPSTDGAFVGDEDFVRIKNPDGSKSAVVKNEAIFLGGRIIHVGHAGLAPTDPPYQNHTPDPKSPAANRRRAKSATAMVKAFRRQLEGDETVDQMTWACVEIESKWGERFMDGSPSAQVDNNTANDSALCATHRWIITILPSDVIKQVVTVATLIRSAWRAYKPMLKTDISDLDRLFAGLDTATPDNRHEIIALMNSLLELPYGCNVYTYSETNDKVHEVQREFKRGGKCLPLLPMDASSTQILDYIHEEAGLIDHQVCFWCEKNKLSTSLSICNNCRFVTYCSVDCQKNDYRAFHKQECTKIKEGGTTEGGRLGLKYTRSNSLRSSTSSAVLPLHVFQDPGSVFYRDIFVGYPTCIDRERPVVTEKVKLFPYGMCIRSREIGM